MILPSPLYWFPTAANFALSVDVPVTIRNSKFGFPFLLFCAEKSLNISSSAAAVLRDFVWMKGMDAQNF